ncbi:peptidylprolyl isomerase [Paenibacillus sp. DYY-L-2]|uniref:peptidylprolyl isomerase n=1 Tax=Paenibacillus sp. DYY-L-2 TaxID=3447013 RepID=UPI003F4FA5D3
MDEKENKGLDSTREPEDQQEPAEQETVTGEGAAEAGQAPVEDTEEDTQKDTDNDGIIPNLQEGEALALMTPIGENPSAHSGDGDGGGGGGKSRNLVWPIVSAVLAILLVVVLIKPPFASNKAEAVATVNGKEITKDQLYEEVSKAGGGEAALDTLITKELIFQEADKSQVAFTEADIDKEIQDYITQFGSAENLDQALAANGMSMEQLRENIQMNGLLTKLLEPQVKVTDEDIKKTFDENKASFDTPEQVRASVILVKTEAEANEIIKELNAGQDFAELAKSKSLDEYTKANGGDLDFFARGEQEEAVEEAAFKLAKGEISSAVKTSQGYEVIKVTDRKEAHSATLEEKKDEIKKQLVSQKVSELTGTWLQDVRSKAKITNTLTDQPESGAAKAE